MKTERKFTDALKMSMEESPLEEITVASLCRRCHVKRQTFYYHFHDMYDLLMVTYLHESIERLEEANNLDDVLNLILTYYRKNHGFVDATLVSMGKDLFIEFIRNAIYTSFLRFINQSKNGQEITLNERKAISRYHSDAVSNAFVTFITTRKNKTLEDLKKEFIFLPRNFLLESVKEIIKKKNS